MASNRRHSTVNSYQSRINPVNQTQRIRSVVPEGGSIFMTLDPIQNQPSPLNSSPFIRTTTTKFVQRIWFLRNTRLSIKRSDSYVATKRVELKSKWGIDLQNQESERFKIVDSPRFEGFQNLRFRMQDRRSFRQSWNVPIPSRPSATRLEGTKGIGIVSKFKKQTKTTATTIHFRQKATPVKRNGR